MVIRGRNNYGGSNSGQQDYVNSGVDMDGNYTFEEEEKGSTFLGINIEKIGKKKIQSGIITAISIGHSVTPILTRMYRSKKTGIPEKLLQSSDIPSIVNSAVNLAFSIDDIVFNSKFQDKYSFAKGIKTATNIYTSVPIISKAANTFLKVRKAGYQDTETFGLKDYFDLLPIASSVIVPMLFDNSVSLKGTLGLSVITWGGNRLNRLVAKSGNRKAMNALNLLRTTSTIASQVVNNPTTRQMVSTSQNEALRGAADGLGTVSSILATALTGSQSAGGYNMNMYGGSYYMGNNGMLSQGYNPQGNLWRRGGSY